VYTNRGFYGNTGIGFGNGYGHRKTVGTAYNWLDSSDEDDFLVKTAEPPHSDFPYPEIESAFTDWLETGMGLPGFRMDGDPENVEDWETYGSTFMDTLEWLQMVAEFAVSTQPETVATHAIYEDIDILKELESLCQWYNEFEAPLSQYADAQRCSS